MDYTVIKKSSLKLFIGFLGLTALVAIVSVLTGSFGDTQLKILGTCFTVSAASISSMACAAFIERKHRVRLGVSGILLNIAAATLLVVGLWANIRDDEYWKTMATLAVFAIGFAHGFLLSLPSLSDRQKWVQRTAPLTIGALAILINIAVWLEPGGDQYYRFLTVVAIVVVLQTLVIPILARMQKGSAEEPIKRLSLKHVGDNLYVDGDGQMFEVREYRESNSVPTEPEASVGD